MNAEIITVGNELTSGRTVDSNAAFLARALTALGFSVPRHLCIEDDRRALAAAIRETAVRADLILVTGGLGPTADDVTREAVADAAGVGLVEAPEVLAEIRARIERRGRVMSPSNAKQALCPEGAERLPNHCGTAPGIRIEIDGCALYVLPGVPSEMRAMLAESVLPRLPRAGRVTVTRVLSVFGVPESVAGETCGRWMRPGSVPLAGITAEDYVLKIAFSASAETETAAMQAIAPVAAEVVRRLGDAVFSREQELLQNVVGGMIAARGLTLAAGESCTGGLIAHRITQVPGASDYFLQGIVAYSNAAKQALLRVPAGRIEAHGAVSAEVACAMAEGARAGAGASLGIGVTGIAGPGGGTPEKPVGLVHAAVAGDAGTRAEAFLIHGDRVQIQDRAAKCVLNLLRLYLLNDLA